MQNFTFHNPTKVIFGKETLAELKNEIPKNSKILLTYGGGSIKKNGVYDQVKKALDGYSILEFGGIEANPQYETCMQAVRLARQEKIDFLLSIGGGSVLDASKFIACATPYKGKDPWDFVVNSSIKIKKALPVGAVLTLPATGSEMNANSVISRAEIGEKRAFGSKFNYPKFSILDPTTTFSLPKEQIANGIVDAFVHVAEQYFTYNVNAPIQDRFAESILKTLVKEGPKALKNPHDYNVRANIMWAATMALNGLIGSGVPGDWQTHMIGHELTALFDIDHARTLSIILPAVLKHQQKDKREKILQYGKRVWGIVEKDKNKAVKRSIKKTINFFKNLDMPTCLKDVGKTPQDCQQVVKAHQKRKSSLGEHGNITFKEIAEILEIAA